MTPPLWLTNLAARARALLPSSLATGFQPAWEALPPLTVDADGWLVGDGVTIIKSHRSWQYPGLATKDGEPEAIVAHYTATDPGTAVGMAKRRVQPWADFAAGYRRSYPGKPVPQNSWHVSAEANGALVQMASFKVGCWHAVGSIKGVGAANRTSASVELVGHGKVFPDLQVLGAARLWRALVRAYAVPEALAMVPHAVIDPEHRSDPGPVWMRQHAPAVLEYAFAS